MMNENMTELAYKYSTLKSINSKSAALRKVWCSVSIDELILLEESILQVEQDFRTAQERYDRFVERHYLERYEPWYEEVSERYRRRIRRHYFLLQKLEILKADTHEALRTAILSTSSFEEDWYDYQEELYLWRLQRA